MKNVTLVAALVTSIAFSANAMAIHLDTDGDVLLSLSELQVQYPELSEELFQEMDTDGDGFINDEEMVAAIGGELIADPETDS